MVADLSVVVACGEHAPDMMKLVHSLDEQVVPYDHLELLVVTSDPEDADLRLLAATRPYFRVLQAETTHEGAQLAQGLQVAEGDFIYLAQPTDVLFPEATARLIPFARALGSDVLLARTVGDKADAQHVTANVERVEGDVLSELSGHGGRLYRRAWLGQFADVIAASGVPSDACVHVSAYADYPLMRRGASLDHDLSTEELALGRPTVAWSGDDLQVLVSGTAAHPLPQGLQVHVVLRQVASSLEVLCPAQWSPGDGKGGSSISVEATISVKSAIAGDPLPDGMWEILVRLTARGMAFEGVVPVVALPRALLADTLVVPRNVDGQLQLDVGSTRGGFLRSAKLDEVSLRQGREGALMTVALPEHHVTGTAIVNGHCGVGSLRLLARLISDGSMLRMECYVSGLAGTHDLTTFFGGGKGQPTGLQLKITGTGEMSVRSKPVVPTPREKRPQPKASPQTTPIVASTPPLKPRGASEKVSAQTRPPGGPSQLGTQPVLTRLRRQVPSGLEPAVRRLSRNSAARWFYRKATGPK